MSFGKLVVVKQEMARINIDILGISELKWMGMDEFNSDGYHIYNCGIHPRAPLLDLQAPEHTKANTLFFYTCCHQVISKSPFTSERFRSTLQVLLNKTLVY